VDWKTKIGERHSDWVNIVRALGERQYAEDIVQDMYCRIFSKYDEDQCMHNGEPNEALVFIVLRNIFYIYKSGNNCISQRYVPTFVDYMNVVLTDEMKDESYDEFLDRLDELKSTWCFFDRKIFELHVGTYGSPNSQDYGKKWTHREIAKESGIGRSTINHTLKNCKESIRTNLEQDWNELIK
jgi:DNA-directed RNA polymerase specialized sigma24 family protein